MDIRTPPPFQRLVDRHAAEVHRFLAALVGPHDAQDALQETFLSALRAYPVDVRHPRAWLLTIARRKAVDVHRRRARQPVPVEEVPETAHTDPPPPDDGLWAEVRALPPKQRDAVAGRFVLDLGYDELATLLDCSPEAARRSVHEGIVKLRERIAP